MAAFIFSISTILTSPLFAGAWPENPFTNQARGTAGAAFLKLPVSARNSSLADTIGYSMADPLSGWRDPSAFAGQPGRQYLSLGSGLLPENIVQAAVAYGLPLGEDGKKRIFISANEVIQPAITLYDTLGQESGEFSPLDSAIMTGYAAYGHDWRWGAGLTYIQSTISPSYNGQGLAASAGAHFMNGFFTDPNLSLGFTLNNFGPSLEWAEEQIPLPAIAQAHMGYKVGDPIFLFFDVMAPIDQAAYGAMSFEWKIPFQLLDNGAIDPATGLAIRAGGTFKNNTESYAEKLSFGLGLYLGDLVIDVGMSSYGDLGYVPHVGLNLDFGAPEHARSSHRNRKKNDSPKTQELPGFTETAAASALINKPGLLKTAVVNFEGRGLPATQTTALTDFFRSALIEENKFDLIDRQDIEIAVTELDLGQTPCSSVDCALKIAQRTTADIAFFATAVTMKNGYFLTIQLLDSSSGQKLSTLTAKSKSYRGLIQKVQKMAHDFARQLKGKSSPQTKQEVKP